MTLVLRFGFGFRDPPPQQPHARSRHRVRKNRIRRIWYQLYTREMGGVGRSIGI